MEDRGLGNVGFNSHRHTSLRVTWELFSLSYAIFRISSTGALSNNLYQHDLVLQQEITEGQSDPRCGERRVNRFCDIYLALCKRHIHAQHFYLELVCDRYAAITSQVCATNLEAIAVVF